jgi:hypothetical protein
LTTISVRAGMPVQGPARGSWRKDARAMNQHEYEPAGPVGPPARPALAPRRERRASGRKRLAGLSLALLVSAAACTTTGTGVGTSPSGAVHAIFTWTASSPRTGTMNAVLDTGDTFQGPFFQVTEETRIDELGPLWVGWGPRRRWRGWDFWGPRQDVVTHYTGKVLANLLGPGGRMRCEFTLMRPSVGMAGGGTGRCQLPDGTIIDADFPPA